MARATATLPLTLSRSMRPPNFSIFSLYPVYRGLGIFTGLNRFPPLLTKIVLDRQRWQSKFYHLK